MALKVSMSVQMRDPINGEIVSTTLTDINPIIFSGGTITEEQAYQAADTVARRICALSNNTFVDAIITTSESTTEHLAG